MRNGVYKVDTRKKWTDMMRRVERENPYMRWFAGEKPTEFEGWGGYREKTCIRLDDGTIYFADEDHYINQGQTIIPYVHVFRKHDMKLGQLYLMRSGEYSRWSEIDFDVYEDDLRHNERDDFDVMVVYHPDSVWVRLEKKFRVKELLTEEQAERLGMEFCEVVE